MSLLKRILGWLGVVVHVEQTGICVVCQQGPNPALGVPIPTTDGSWKHLVCMIAGQQIGQAAELANAQSRTAGPPVQQPNPIIVAIVRPAGREVWN